MHRLGLARRDSLRCECGAGGCELGVPPDCDQYRIAWCQECGERWAIYTGKKR